MVAWLSLYIAGKRQLAVISPSLAGGQNAKQILAFLSVAEVTPIRQMTASSRHLPEHHLCRSTNTNTNTFTYIIPNIKYISTKQTNC